MEILKPYLVAIGGLLLLTSLWVLVQRAWQRSFPEEGDGDVLACRGNCGSCGCTGKPKGREV